jgi:hypothetical protein
MAIGKMAIGKISGAVGQVRGGALNSIHGEISSPEEYGDLKQMGSSVFDGSWLLKCRQASVRIGSVQLVLQVAFRERYDRSR